MKDPFATLQLYEDFTVARISAAFAAAVRRGERPIDAREAMDALRDPLRREAMRLLAPSMTATAVGARARLTSNPDADEAVAIVLKSVGAALDEMDRALEQRVQRPVLVYDVRMYLSVPEEALKP